MSGDALRGHFERQGYCRWGVEPCSTPDHWVDDPAPEPPYDRQREEHARDLLRAWADAASNAGCPPSFVARMRTFADMHDRHASEATA